MLKKDIAQTLESVLKDRINVSSDYLFYYIDAWDESDYFNNIILEECAADDFKSGASKIVLFYHDLKNWVVKLPYFGEYDDIEGSDIYDINNRNYYDGAGLHLKDGYCLDRRNYCNVEAYIANKAVEEGIGDMFAKTYYLFNKNGVPVYVSEKIEEISCNYDIEYIRQDSAAQAKSLYSCYIYECGRAGFYDEEIFRCFVDQYGEEKTEKLISFISNYEINDLNSFNIGFDRFGKIKIIDYSGFYEGDRSRYEVR